MPVLPEEFTKFTLKRLSEKERKLVEAYPLLYLEPDAELEKWYPPQDRCNLRWGFEFEEGWLKIAEDFSRTASDLVDVLRRSGLQPDAYIHACIFKEKFGALRWQGNHNLKEPFMTLFEELTRSLERHSEQICEITGKSGKLWNVEGWMCTLCEEEYAKYLRQANLDRIEPAADWTRPGQNRGKSGDEGPAESIIMRQGRYAYLRSYANLYTDYVSFSEECFSAVKDGSEVTVVCEERYLPQICRQAAAAWFQLLELAASQSPASPGRLAQATAALAGAGLDPLVISAFTRDYILVPEDKCQLAVKDLEDASFSILKKALK